jgi:hypothetical protein
MNQQLLWIGKLFGAIMLVALTSGCAGTGVSGGESSSRASEAPGGARVSSGTQGDTLEACLARIPSDATEGQRILAEGSCHRDAKNQKPIDAVPGN